MRIAKILADLVKDKQWDHRLGLHKVFHFWDEAVGEEIAGKAQPFVIRGTVLWVSVSDSMWMQRLHLEKLVLLGKINTSLPGSEALTDMRFQLGRPIVSLQEPPGESEPSPVVDTKELEKYEKFFMAIPDEEVRKSLLNLWIQSSRHRR